VKIVTVIGLASFLTLALITQIEAEEHYIYKDPHGRLVISNKQPPPKSNVLKKLELPESSDAHVQQTQEHGSSEGAANPSEKK
jgi:hypothetical protein